MAPKDVAAPATGDEDVDEVLMTKFVHRCSRLPLNQYSIFRVHHVTQRHAARPSLIGIHPSSLLKL
jgi:hypothetical protein